ncbi:MAG: hypothetical protein U0165_05205 [Polyangiaceae bacterium]
MTGWEGTWRTDPAAFDGALQLALLWADRVLCGATLPMSISELRLYRVTSEGAFTMRCDAARCAILVA